MSDIYVYVDGFNLYYSIKDTPHRWLNLKSLTKALVPGHNILKIKYFTIWKYNYQTSFMVNIWGQPNDKGSERLQKYEQYRIVL